MGGGARGQPGAEGRARAGPRLCGAAQDGGGERNAMTDYGHDLLFGSFLTPDAGHADAVVELARLADGLGLDLLGVQDHPYQPRFFDMWTLLSVLAAQTERIRLVPDVVNLPLRPPAVFAGAAASLDILSGGQIGRAHV